MKELSIEEKAKRYDKALEIINDYYQKIKYSSLSSASNDREVLERAFSELKDSKDEKIKKRIIALVNAHGQGMYKDEMLAWIEKQGEQKSIDDLTPQEAMDIAVAKCFEEGEQKYADKVEPKFKIGQTIKKEGFNMGFTIAKIEDDFYYNDDGDYFPFTDQDNWELVGQKPWSEEDEQTFIKSVEALEDFGKFELADWLKEHKSQCLTPKSRWKPSDEEMRALADALSLANNCGEENAFDLRTLYEQLKKLKN